MSSTDDGFRGQMEPADDLLHVYGSILVNGPPTGFFQQGLATGSSFMLFNLVMESLSHLISKAKQGGFLEDYRGRLAGGA